MFTNQIKTCLLTDLPVIDDVKWTTRDNFEVYWYWIDVNGLKIPVSLCASLYDKLSWSESDISKILKKNRSLLIGEFAKDDFQSLKGKVFHLACNIQDKPNHLRLKDFIDEII